MIITAKTRPRFRECLYFSNNPETALKDDVINLNEAFGRNWAIHDTVDVEWPREFKDDKKKVVIWNTKLHMWLPLPEDWIAVAGLHGEYWPVDQDTFAEMYNLE